MLYQLLAQVCEGIEKLDVSAELPQMFAQINRARPDLMGQIARASKNPEAQGRIAQAIAFGALNCIKGIPKIANFLAAKTKERRVAPQVRCALASVLSYLVQPLDLLPDDAPGGYGYIDDSAVLRAGLIEYLKIDRVPQFDKDEEVQYANMVASLLPPAVVPTFQLVVGNMATAFQIMRALPGEIAELTLQQIIANPLQASAPATPQGFSPVPTPSYGGGHWSGGGYFEGGNVVVPGGPSLIDGNLFIPD